MAINAVMAGIGVAPLPHRLAHGLVDVGDELGLPELPGIPVIMRVNHVEPQSRATLQVLIAAIRNTIPRKGVHLNAVSAKANVLAAS